MPHLNHPSPVLLLFWGLAIIASCRADWQGNDNPPMPLRQPEGFPKMFYTVSDNPPTEKGFALGKKLFFDPILSIDSTIACSSCHLPSAAFSDPGKRISTGVKGQSGKRNTPALQNLAWSNAFFWDGGVFLLDLVPHNPISNAQEMAHSVPGVLDRLRQNAEYRRLFGEIYGVDTISSRHFLFAMSQFMIQLIRDNSKYDQYKRGKAEFSSSEVAGLALFQKHCATCHSGELFTTHNFQNNGLDGPNPPDFGRYLVSLLEPDLGKFKVPSLRNIAVTPPYMHDGRFLTLEAVLEHYSKGIQNSPTLASPLPMGGFNFSQKEQQDIISFLNTLTDVEFLNNRQFQKGE